MSDQINDGGPAFPTGEKIDNSGHIERYMVGGMTLRDYFAANLASEVTISDKEIAETLVGREWPSSDIEVIQFAFDLDARLRYMKADAMLRAREAK